MNITYPGRKCTIPQQALLWFPQIHDIVSYHIFHYICQCFGYLWYVSFPKWKGLTSGNPIHSCVPSMLLMDILFFLEDWSGMFGFGFSEWAEMKATKKFWIKIIFSKPVLINCLWAISMWLKQDNVTKHYSYNLHSCL